MNPPAKLGSTLRARMGIDGAVAYAFLARATSIVSSAVTVLLIVRTLNSVEQGYYYTLLSLASLQVIFELGFSFVVQQLAAHEWIHLAVDANGEVKGDPVAHTRLASTLQFSVRWYLIAGAAMIALIAPFGWIFFDRHQSAGAAQILWQGPWFLVVVACAIGLVATPFYAFLEGCGEVRAVAAMRLRQSIAGSALAWLAMLLHHGLYAPALLVAGQLAAGIHFLHARRRFLRRTLRHPIQGDGVNWSREVWPFQWRIAVSWMCSYFTVQVFIPILFGLRGPVEAGQMGMSLSITGYMTVLALVWTSTKATPFGHLIARGDFDSLDRLFRHALRHTLAAFAAISLPACAFAALLPTFAPGLARRMVSPRLFAVLALAAGASCVVQSLATLLRSFKREPFLAQSLVSAGLTLALAALTAPRWGATGAALSYLGVSLCVALPSALVIFSHARRDYLPLVSMGRRGSGCQLGSDLVGKDGVAESQVGD